MGGNNKKIVIFFIGTFLWTITLLNFANAANLGSFSIPKNQPFKKNLLYPEIKSFAFPESLEAINDHHSTLSDSDTNILKDESSILSSQNINEKLRYGKKVKDDRTFALKNKIGASLRMYNLQWVSFELNNFPKGALNSSDITCNSSSVKVPKDEVQKNLLGLRYYRCLDKSALERFDSSFLLDQKNHLQSGIVFYGTPKNYRDPLCEGFTFNGNFLQQFCVPLDSEMDHYKDFLKYIAWRYNGKNHFGKISHYIIWNENASPDWFDFTPRVSKTARDDVSIDLRMTKYANMFKDAYESIKSSSENFLLYVGTDMIWETPTGNNNQGHFGSKRLLTEFWKKVGTTIPWAVAIHPYSPPTSNVGPNLYNFSGLDLVSNFQKKKLKESGITGTEAKSYPQFYLFASEQGWPRNLTTSLDDQARYICEAHNIVSQRNDIIAVSNNYFHSTDSQESRSAISGQSSFMGLIPYEAKVDLSDVQNYATGAAYLSTHPENWGRSNGHYCCTQHQLGCLKTPGEILGVIDSVSSSGTVSGWACQKNIPQSIDIHLYAGGPAGQGTFLVKVRADQASNISVINACGVLGSYNFKATLRSEQLAQYKNEPLYIHGISTNNGQNLLLRNSGKYSFLGENAPCLINGKNIDSGSSLTFFEKSVAPYGTTCKSEVRSCFNGVLKGSYTEASCTVNQHPPGAVKGVIDSVIVDQNNSRAIVNGWVCQEFVQQSIPVHIYAGGKTGVGTKVAVGIADLSSEAAVLTACGVSAGGYRFSVLIPPDMATQFKGKAIYIHGISTSNQAKDHLLISNSGKFNIP